MASDRSNEPNSGSSHDIPFVFATPTTERPIDNKRLSNFSASFTNKTVAQRYFGPGWVNDEGIACIIFIAHDKYMPQYIRKEGKCGSIAWRWNIWPSTPLSLTIMVSKNPRPHVRWMRPSEDPVVAAMCCESHFYMNVANSKGQQSGWFKAVFFSGSEKNRPSKIALENQFSFPIPGIPYSSTHQRFDPSQHESFNENHEDEIPLWPDAMADQWATLGGNGPWSEDIQHRDRAKAAWACQACKKRGQAAGFLQVILERQNLDGISPIVDAEGLWQHADSLQDRAIFLAQRVPTIGRLLAAIAGPVPKAKLAYDVAFEMLHEPYAVFCFFDKLLDILVEFEDEILFRAFEMTFEAVLLDYRITECGTNRPWLLTNFSYDFELKTMSIDLDAPLEDIEQLWSTGLEMMDLIDIGLRVNSHDFPVPFETTCATLESVFLESTAQEAEERVQALMEEAQDARQWSIPWGARVEISFGPFVSMRIFERNGEFACHFLDDQERYFHVAIGLHSHPPKIAINRLIRTRQDDGEPTWNDDAEVSLKLIAAAIVRDFIIVEERESLFTTRKLRKRIRGHDIKTVIYLPRVRYSKPNPNSIGINEALIVGAKHNVSAHLRKAKSASATQRFLAQRYGMHVPEGFTFVRAHERGTAVEEARIRVYRSRSASKMIFEEVAQAPEGTRPAWFDFEKDCARLLADRGMRVIHQSANRDGDGGVDLYAVDSDNQSLVVQCKCWASHRSIGPNVVRELEGAIKLADKGSEAQSRGMIITTSRFTKGAISDAESLGYHLIDGEQIAKLLAEKTN